MHVRTMCSRFYTKVNYFVLVYVRTCVPGLEAVHPILTAILVLTSIVSQCGWE